MGWLWLIPAFMVLLFVLDYNRLIRLRTSVEEAWFSMDVFLKKRYDLIPNLVETVKGYASHESQVLEKLVHARNQALSAGSHEAVVEQNRVIGAGIRDLFALVEAYPDLKANSSFLSLQQSLAAIETEIANARLYYNGHCKQYNRAIQSFPTLLVAGAMRAQPSPYFNAEESERSAVQVRF